MMTSRTPPRCTRFSNPSTSMSCGPMPLSGESALAWAVGVEGGDAHPPRDDADDRRVAPRVGADGARIDVGHVVARRAAEDLLLDLHDRVCQRLSLGPGPLENVVG